MSAVARSRSVIAAGAAALLLATAGCGGDDAPGTAGEAPEPTRSVDPPGAELTEKTFVSTVSGAMLEASTVRVDTAIDTASGPLTIEGTQQIGKKLTDTALDITLSGPQLSGRMILVDGSLFIDLGPITENDYVEIDLENSGPGSESFEQLLDSTDTAAAVEALGGAITGLRSVGSQDLDGVATTKYELRVDTAKALGNQDLPPDSLAQLPKTLTYRMWVGDDDGLLRRLTFETLGSTTTMTLSQWGEPVDIAAPPAAQISKANPFAAAS